jgi:hypothetical protein
MTRRDWPQIEEMFQEAFATAKEISLNPSPETA